MDDTLYDTSWTLFFIHNNDSDNAIPTAFRNLLRADQSTLNSHASKLHNYLSTTGTGSSRRPRYEDEEEREKIGGLRDCEWSPLSSAGRQMQRTASSLLITLTYEKATYKFIIHSGRGNNKSTNTTTTSRSASNTNNNNPLPLLLAKASAPLTKRITSFLTDTYHVAIEPLKLRPSLLQTTLQEYLSSLYSAAAASSSSPSSNTKTNTLALLRSTLGTIKLTIAISSAALVTPSLRSIDLDIPPETTHQLLVQSQSTSTSTSSDPTSFLTMLAQHIHARTGLKLPVIPLQSQAQSNGSVSSSLSAKRKSEDTNSIDAIDNAVLRLVRISCAAYALSAEGKLKFASKAVLDVDDLHLDDNDVGGATGNNSFGEQVRRENERILLCIVDEAVRRADSILHPEEGGRGAQREDG